MYKQSLSFTSSITTQELQTQINSNQSSGEEEGNMAGENEPAKLLLPYLQRADELQKHEPLVAYYCRLYAMERGLKIPQSDRTKTTKDLLVSLMKQLEKDKKSLNLVPDDRFHLEEFALNVFSKADKQDRAGRADLNTAKTFYAASIFFEIINQFGELPSDLEEKQKYAAWKAADIRKAVKEGRKPVPGPPGGEKDISVQPSEHGGDHDLEQRTVPFSGPGRDMDYQPKPRMDQAMGPSYGTGTSPQVNDAANFQHPADIASPPSNNVASTHNIPPSPSYPSNGYVQDFHQPPPASEDSYSRVYHQPTYQQEHHLPTHYASQDASPYSYPNFQSYPSFTESSLPAVPSHYPSYQMGPDSSYPTSLPPNGVQHTSSGEYDSSGRNVSVPEFNPPAAKAFQYDSNYMPSPEKITEAHKAARFAVGALAFDDVSTAVDHLRKSLELLTNPSAGQ